MDTSKEPFITAALLATCHLAWLITPESFFAVAKTIVVLLLMRSFFVFCRVAMPIINENRKDKQAFSMTPVSIVLHIYRQHGWTAAFATHGNVVISALVFLVQAAQHVQMATN